MDSFELNKIAGAVLGSLLLILGVNKVVGMIFSEHELEKKAYIVEGVVEEGAEGATAAAAPAAVPLPVLLASADATKGEKIAKQCVSCHSFVQGGANLTGPNLYGVVGGPLAHKEDFSYSDAFKAEHAAGKTWTYDALFGYLRDPKSFLPGNKMAFAGVRKDEQRADLIAYLTSISPNAPAFPVPEAAPAPAPESGESPPAPDAATPPAGPAPATEGAPH